MRFVVLCRCLFFTTKKQISKKKSNELLFSKENIFQNNYPIGLFKFKYGAEAKSESSSFATSSMHDDKVVHLSEYRNRTYVEFLSNLLDDTCYPTKYIFEEYPKFEAKTLFS